MTQSALTDLIAVVAGPRHSLSLKATGPTICRGDLNCDGRVCFDNINPFVLVASNRDLWQRLPGRPEQNANVDGDGQCGGVNGLGDINSFVRLLTSVTQSSPRELVASDGDRTSASA